MPYLIDGHNLIPKLGLRLDSPDDEMELVAILQEFARLERRDVEVYFDGAPVGFAGTRTLGKIKAHFIRQGTTADHAIRARLMKMGRTARNWIVVTSDREVQLSARGARSSVISSDEFAKMLKAARDSAPKANTDDRKLSAHEVEEWLKYFREK